MTQPGFTSFALINSSTPYGRAQTISVTAHLAIVVALCALLAAHQGPLPLGPTIILGIHHSLPPYIPPATVGAGEPRLGRASGGGEKEPLAARNGLLAPRSSMPLVPPHLLHRDEVALPAPPAVFEPNAPANVLLITYLGLPWMTKDTDSAGPGKGHGIGSGDGGGDGDGSGNGAGMAEGSDYGSFVSLATCVYCPEPPYSEQARKAKLQGMVTLRVLIGSDGRAKRVQVLKGLGLGLDERASEAVRAWRFAPAKNARREPAPSWVTIETRFQLL
jgi:TonB family protein